MNDVQAKTVALLRAGEVEYEAAWAMQRHLVRQRSAGEAGDTLVLMSHPHTYTLGRATKAGHILVPLATLAEQGVAVVESDRGGDITYHGPGQIVGYPILKLSRHGGDIIRYLRQLEDVIIRVLASYGLRGERIARLTGVWVGDEKVCAIGVKMSASGITHHGFALNVSTDLHFFAQIIPCGIVDRGVTSLEKLLGAAPSHAEVEQRIVDAFGEVFGVAVL